MKSKLSRRARGLLFKLDDSLKKSKKYLADCRELMVPKCWIIDDQNTLKTILQKCQVHFNEQQIDLLFTEFIGLLDGKKKEFVLKILQTALDDIDQNDHLQYQIDDEYNLIRNRYQESENVCQIINYVRQYNNCLLTQDTIKQIFNDITYYNQQMIKTMIEDLMKGEQAIFIHQFQQRLGLVVQKGKSEIEQLLQCPLFKDKNKKIKQFINPHSNSDKRFLFLAIEVLNNNKTYMANNNPYYYKSKLLLHFGVDRVSYSLFSRQEQKFTPRLIKVLIKRLSPHHVIMGQINDKYFISAISIIVDKYPEIIFGLFTLFKNPSHIYGIRLFVDGQWRNISTDTQFHTNTNGDFCGTQSDKQIIWPMLLQKAFAIVNGSYESIQNGTISEGMKLLTGAPSFNYHLVKGDNFWVTAQHECEKGSVITCWDEASRERGRQNNGLLAGHYYRFLQVFPNIYGCDNQEHILFKLRDPQGRQTPWKGKWSIIHPIWTTQSRKKVRFSVDAMDGTFFMCQEDFYSYFAYANICRIKTMNKNSTCDDLQLENGQFAAVDITIIQKGKYSITNYLRDSRTYLNRYNNQRYSWMVLLKQLEGNFQRVSCSLYRDFNTTLQTAGQLQKGKYKLVLMAKWPLHDKQMFLLTSYGPQYVQMKKTDYSQYFIESEIDTVPKIFFQQNRNISRQVKLHHQAKYGLIVIQNKQKGILRLKISFKDNNNVILIPHIQNQGFLEVLPKDRRALKCIFKHTIDESQISFEHQYLQNY